MVVLIAMIHDVSHPDHTEAVVVPRLPHHAHLPPLESVGIKLVNGVIVIILVVMVIHVASLKAVNIINIY